MSRSGSQLAALLVAFVAAIAGELACSDSEPSSPRTCAGAATEACTIQNGQGQRSRTCKSDAWSAWGSCTPTGCDPGYVVQGNTCHQTTPGTVAVEVAPATAKLAPGATQQFTATVTGAQNTAVSWGIDEAPSCGTITAAGLYTAPPAAATCHVRATSVADTTKSATATVTVSSSAGGGSYPFEGYTTTRGAFEAIADNQPSPVVLIVDSLDGASSGDEATQRGTLAWALTRSYPRVILFEVSGTIHLDNWLEITSPYVSVYGQTAPSPGVTLYGAELIIRTHDVIFQHLRIRMGEQLIGMGDPLDVAGLDDTVHDVIIDHCSVGLGHDEQIDLTSGYSSGGDVRRVTISNSIVSHGLTVHNFALIIDSGDNNNHSTDEIFVNGNLFSQVSDRTPLINPAARHVTVTNNVIYNLLWNGPFINTAGYPEGLYVDYMNNLYWRGPRTKPWAEPWETTTPFWPRDEVSTWPSQPSLWPSSWPDEPTARLSSTNGSTANTQVYYEGNYQYVNNKDYSAGNHEGRPVILDNERFTDGLTLEAVKQTSRVTNVKVTLKTPIQIEQGLSTVGASQYRDQLDDLAVNTAKERNGDWILHESDLGVPAYPSSSDSRDPTTLTGYPTGHLLSDTDGDGLTDLENWIYGLYP